MSTVWDMNAPTVSSKLLATPNTIAIATTVLFAAASVTFPATVRTVSAPSAMTQGPSSLIVHSPRTPVVVSSSTMGIQRGFDLAPVVQVFEEGIVTIGGTDLIFSIIHLPLLTVDSPLTFTTLIRFSSNNYCYTMW